MRDRRPDILRSPPAIPRERIDQCLAAVEIALARANREEAYAAIDRAFLQEPVAEITLESHVSELGLDVRLVNTLEDQSILTVGDLCQTSLSRLSRTPNIGKQAIDKLRAALAKHGLSLRDCAKYSGL